MKRLILGVVLSLCAVWAMAAAPTNNSVMNTVSTATAVDSQHNSAAWNYVDSMIVIKTDTCYTDYIVCGYATVSPGDKLYIGLIDGGSDVGASPTDTSIFTYSARNRGNGSLYFYAHYRDSLESQTDANDTIYVVAAVKGGSKWEEVTIDSLWFGGFVTDQ